MAATLAVPLCHRGRVLGVLAAAGTAPGSFSTTDLDLLMPFASALGAVVAGRPAAWQERRRAVDGWRALEARYLDLAERIGDTVYTADGAGRVTYLNPAGRRLFGRSPDAGLGVADLVAPEAREQAAAALEEVLRGDGGPRSLELPVVDAEGRVRRMEHAFGQFEDESAAPAVQVVVREVVDGNRLERRIADLTDHDPLTGLLAGPRFEHELAGYLEFARQGGFCGALLWIDLDRFTELNEAHGRLAGDELLVAAARVLQAQLRRSDVAARTGGDEFAVLLRGADAEEAAQVASRILNQISRHSPRRPGLSFRASASLGIALLPEHGSSAGECLALAEGASFQARGEGGGVCRAAGPVAGEGGSSRLTWVRRVREGLDRQMFRLFAQPIAHVATGRVERYEVLLRLLAPDGGVIAPGAFLGAAEGSSLIQEIDRFVVRQAIRLLDRPELRHVAGLEVNLSGRAFADAELLSLIQAELREVGVDPGRLILEITETAAVADLRKAQRFIATLREMGCLFALDDFGVGFSSFHYLRHLPVDDLKIDGSFVRDLKASAVDRHLVQGIAHMARGLGKKTVAEFVEDEATLELVRSYGIDYAQGLRIGPPLPVTSLIDRT
jgi:diguanylate cyclase (GGDEF)-like protein/PAS domain S-box-containing protein